MIFLSCIVSSYLLWISDILLRFQLGLIYVFSDICLIISVYLKNNAEL